MGVDHWQVPMMVLVGKSPTTISRDHPHSNVGIIISPRKRDAYNAARCGLLWAADNDCWNGGLDEPLFRLMLEQSEGATGCLFVAAPDVVGDSETTLDWFDEWVNVIASHGFPVALVLQDGMTPEDVRWLEVDAVFIGGTTEWKLSLDAYRIVDRAKDQGKWVHMGRVNTRRRLKVAKAWGCDSVDGTSTVMFTDTHLPWQLI
jgi:hypothetical protein